jgi:hypothetical protein
LVAIIRSSLFRRGNEARLAGNLNPLGDRGRRSGHAAAAAREIILRAEALAQEVAEAL